jgi:hypothetical protein
MADLDAIRGRLKTNLQAVSGLFCFDVMPTQPPATLPCAIVSPAPGAFLAEVTFDGVEDLQLVVTVLLQKVVDTVGQADTFLSEGSPNLANVIDSGATADWDYAVAQPARGYGQYVWGAGENATSYLGFEIPVTVGVS